MHAVQQGAEARLRSQVVKILRNAGTGCARIKPHQATGARIAAALEPIECIRDMTGTSLECPDVKGKAMPPIPPANRLLQVLFVKAGNTALFIGTADGIAFLWAV